MDAMAEMVDFAKAAAEENGMKAMIHAHVGSGGMHIHAASDKGREDAAPDAKAFYDAVYAKVSALGGDVRGEYGVGYAKIAYLGEEGKAAFRAEKERFDPAGVLNPGKIV